MSDSQRYLLVEQSGKKFVCIENIKNIYISTRISSFSREQKSTSQFNRELQLKIIIFEIVKQA